MEIKQSINTKDYKTWLRVLWRGSSGIVRQGTLFIICNGFFLAALFVNREINIYLWSILLFIANLALQKHYFVTKEKTIGWLADVGIDENNACEVAVNNEKITVTYFFPDCKLTLSINLLEAKEVLLFPQQKAVVIENDRTKLNCRFDGQVNRMYEIENIGMLIVPLCVENSDVIVDFLKNNTWCLREINKKHININFG